MLAASMCKVNLQAYMTNVNLILSGYVTSRTFGGFCIPVPLQSLALREYCSRKGYIYTLPTNENYFNESYMVLEGHLSIHQKSLGVVMYSVKMLPESKIRRGQILQKLIQQGREMHFVYEDLKISTITDIQSLNKSMRISSTIVSSGDPRY